jgi:hypothetical protein
MIDIFSEVENLLALADLFGSSSQGSGLGFLSRSVGSADVSMMLGLPGLDLSDSSLDDVLAQLGRLVPPPTSTVESSATAVSGVTTSKS